MTNNDNAAHDLAFDHSTILAVTGSVGEEARSWLDDPARALDEIGPDDVLAPWAVYLNVRAGDKPRGLALALALRQLPLDISTQDPSRVSDLVVSRLWLARVEVRADPRARDVGEELLANDLPIGPHRRALLHYALGADVLTRTPLRSLEALEVANEHLQHALAGARSLDLTRFVRRCQSMLALLEVPRGNLAVAASLCREALAVPPEEAAHDLTSWQLRAHLILQWTRHFQGLPIDPDVLAACVRHPRVRADPTLAVLLTTVTALAAIEAGDVAAARRELSQARSDRRITSLGLWRLPKLMLDGYLSVTHDDTQRTERTLEALASLPAPAEVALVRAQQLSHLGRTTEALDAIAPITSGAVGALSFTYPVALTLEAALLESLGRHDEADRSTARALGAAEPIDALRLFTVQGPAELRVLVRRAAAAAPLNRWVAGVAAYLEDHSADPRDQAYAEPVRTDAVEAPQDREQPPSPLTRRELEVLRLVNDGASNAQVAAQLFVSINTAKTHLRSIRRKMGVSRTIEAAAIARRSGWF